MFVSLLMNSMILKTTAQFYYTLLTKGDEGL